MEWLSEGKKRIIANAALHALTAFLGSASAFVILIGQPNWTESVLTAVVTALIGAAVIFFSDLQKNDFATAAHPAMAKKKKLLGI